MQEALIFGQFGKAVYRQKSDLFLLDLDLEGAIKIRDGDAAFLFDTGGEVLSKTYPKLELNILRKYLEELSLGHDALEMVFDCFDPEFDEETRLACAEAAEELLADETAFTFVRNRMLARPLPEKADESFPRKIIEEKQFSHLSRLLQLVMDCQQDVATVLTAWEEVANQSFTDIRLAYKAKNAFVEEGVFAYAALAAHSKDRNKLGLLPTEFINKPDLRQISNLQRILTDLHGLIKKSLPEDNLPDLVVEKKSGKFSLIAGLRKLKRPKKTAPYDTGEINKLKDAIVKFFVQGKIREGDFKLKELCDFQNESPSYLSMSLSDVAHRIFVKKELFDKAVEIYELAIKKNRKDKVPWCGLGTIYKEKKKYDTALAKYKMAQTLASSDAIVLRGMAEVYRAMREYDTALLTYEKAQSFDPFDSVAWSGMAEVYKAMGEYDTALKKYEKAQSLNPSFVVGLNGMAEVYKAMGEYDTALKKYEKAQFLDPSNAIAWSGMAGVYKAMGEYDTALKKYEKAQSIDPFGAIALSGMAEVYRAMGEYDTALVTYEKAQSLDPFGVIAWSGMAEVYKAMGEYDTALEKYEKAQSIDPSDAVLWNGVAGVYKAMGEYDTALEKYEKAQFIDKRNVISWNGMAGLYKTMGRFQDAENCYLYANENFSHNSYGYCGLGFLWLKVKPEDKLFECKRLFEEAFKMESCNPIVKLGREVVDGLLNQSAIKELADQKWFERTLSFLNKDQNAESRKHASFLKKLETADLSDSEIRRETMSGLGDTGSYLLEEMVL